MFKKKFTLFIRDNFLTGVFVLAPIAAIFWILVWLWNALVGMTQVIPDSLNPKIALDITNPFLAKGLDLGLTLLILFILFAIISTIGLVSRNYLGKQLLQLFRDFISRVPVLRNIYSTLDQIMKTFNTGKSRRFNRVVQIDYPRKGIYTLALVTGERENGLLTVYVPTTPNPTSGFYLMVPKEEVREVAMTVEEALKEIISLGIVHKNE